jgi:hypothetical protein
MRKGQAGVVEGSSFVLRDENGLDRASLKMAAGGPQLALCDSKGNERAVLRVCPEATMLCFLDDQGRKMITLTSLGSAQMLDLHNPQGADGVSMVAAGNTLFGLSDGDKWRVHLVANDHPELQERPCFVVTDRRGKEQVTVVAGPDGPELSLRGPNEKHRLRLKVVKGKPYVELLDGLSRELWRLGTDGQITKPGIRKQKRR